MGNNNVMGLRGGVLAAIIVMMILFFTADQSCAAGNGTTITNFHIDHDDVLFFYDDPESELAAAPTSSKALDPSQAFGCGRPGSIRSCLSHPNGPKKADHCAPAPGSTYPPAKRDC
ncbi:hypothetical protein AB3S75_013464 [Citrus x aurantiifolia]